MTILVSGATGFMGSAITRHLLDAGYRVRAMGRSAERARSVLGRFEECRRALGEGRLTFISADVTRPETLLPAVAGIEVIVQAAQFPGAPNEDPGKGYTYMNIDRNGTMNLLEAISDVYWARTAGPGLVRFPSGSPRFVYLSGITVREEAPDTWNRAKWQAEEAIRGSGLDWTIVRSSMAYGPGDAALNTIIRYSDFMPVMPLFGDGEEKVTPVFVEDVGRVFTLVVAAANAADGATLPLGGPEVLTMNEILRTALSVMRRRRVDRQTCFLLSIQPRRRAGRYVARASRRRIGWKSGNSFPNGSGSATPPWDEKSTAMGVSGRPGRNCMTAP